MSTVNKNLPPPTSGLWESSDLPRLAAVGLIYFLSVKLSLLFPDSANVMAAIWPASGIALASLLLSPQRKWPLLLVVIGIANLVGNISSGKSIPVSAGYLIANIMEPMFAAWMITGLFAHSVRFTQVGEVMALIGAAVLMNGCTAIIGAATATLGANAPFWPAYMRWWVADGMGMLLVTPFIVTLVANAPEMLRTLPRQKFTELVLFALVWCSMVIILFGLDYSEAISHFRLYLLLPLTLWAALRFPPCITATASVILAIVGVVFSNDSLGPFILGEGGMKNPLERIQIFIALVSMNALVLSVSMFERYQSGLKLSDSEYRWKYALEGAGDGVWDWNFTDNTVIYSKRWKEMLGYAEEEVGNGYEEWEKRVHPDDKAGALIKVQEYLDGKTQKYSVEHRLMCKDGNWKWILTRGMIVSRSVDGKPLRMIGTHTDITERKQAEALEKLNEIRATALLNLTLVSKDWSNKELLQAALDQAEQMTGSCIGYAHFVNKDQETITLGTWSTKTLQACDATFDRHYPISKAGVWADSMRQLGPVIHNDYPSLTDKKGLPEGHSTLIRHLSIPVTDESNRVRMILGVGNKIEPYNETDVQELQIMGNAVWSLMERKRLEEENKQLAFYDILTELPNRRLLDDRIQQAMAASKRSGCYGALLFLDLDNFKPLNDKHGHDVGDLLLVEVGRRLTGCVREVDTVARFGGDEFVVLLSELYADRADSITQATLIAEKIRITLAEPYILKVQQKGKAEITVEHHCTATIGIVLLKGHDVTKDEIFKWADMAMYQAKEAGRNSIMFYKSNV